MSRGLPRDGDDDDANGNNNNEEIDLVCHEEMNLSESDDNDDTHESNTSSSPDAYLQYRDYDSSLSNLFYKCNECILDEETELGLEKKGNFENNAVSLHTKSSCFERNIQETFAADTRKNIEIDINTILASFRSKRYAIDGKKSAVQNYQSGRRMDIFCAIYRRHY